ncbi:MAG: hypothetical protein AB1439_00920 [candidate division FCPU426 bacterium]
MLPVSAPFVSDHLLQRWWQQCSATACTLPREYTSEWLQLISRVIRYYRRWLRCSRPSDGRLYRTRCRHTLAKSRWELMVLSMYGYIPSDRLNQLEKLQTALEHSLAD